MSAVAERAFAGLLLLGAALLGGCVIRGRLHPVVEIRTEGGSELGVSTADGVFFLGATAQEGLAEVLLYYGDIPYGETARIVPAGGGLYRLDLEVRHQGVPIGLAWPEPGEDFLVIGLEDGSLWRRSTRLARIPGVHGELYDLPAGWDPARPPLGAGIFRVEPNGGLALVGLVKGTAALTLPGQAEPVRLLCPAGLADLRECLVARRDVVPRREPVYRPDLTRPVLKR